MSKPTVHGHADDYIADYLSPQAAHHLHSHDVRFHCDHAAHREMTPRKGPPHMEIRVKNLSLSVKRTVSDNRGAYKLPTIGSVFTSAFRGITRRGTQRQVTQPILHDVSGVFRPGTMTLVLGQPGAGKSSLLKVLAGRFPAAKDIVVDGHVTYNGVAREALVTRLPQFVAYVPQHDCHYATLTVKETVAFAHACCGGDVTPTSETSCQRRPW